MPARAISPTALADAFTVNRVVNAMPANPFVGFTVTPHFIAGGSGIQSPDVNVVFTNPLLVPVTVNAEYKKNGVNFQATSFSLPAGVSSKFFPHADVLSPWLSTDVVTVTLVSIVPNVTVGSSTFDYYIYPTTPPLSVNPVNVNMLWSTNGVGGTANTTFLYNAIAIPHDPNAPLLVASFTESNDPTFNGWADAVQVVNVTNPATSFTGYEIFNPNPDNGGKAWLPVAMLLANDEITLPDSSSITDYQFLDAADQQNAMTLMTQIVLAFALANAGDDQNVQDLPIPGFTSYGGNVVYKGDYGNYFENMDKFYAANGGGDKSWFTILMWYMSAIKQFWVDEAALAAPGTTGRLYDFVRKFFDTEDARYFLPGGTYQIAEPGSTTTPATAPYDPGLTDYITANGTPILLVMEILSIG